MQNTVDYLDALADHVRANGGTGSDYSIAKLLKISRNRISNYRSQRYGFDDALAIRAAQILGRPVGEVLANIHAARAQDDGVRAAWEQIAKECRLPAH